jgi:chitinase
MNIVAATAWPAHVYAPYVDATLWPTYDFEAAARTYGLRYFTLAFITADPSNRPAWGGYSAYAVGGGSDFETQLLGQINAVRSLGGDVMVSFGGAANRELAEVITDITALKNAYRQVIDAYQLTHIDFDIEGAATADRASVDRRSQAIATLQAEFRAAGRPLAVWFTLPVLPTGLTADGLYVLQSARRFGVEIGGVNIMTMDYGDSAAPNPQGRMGDYAIQAAQSLHAQMRSFYGPTPSDAQLWSLIGLTPMIGMNDVQSEIFDQQEAREVLAFAQQVGIVRLSIWSLNRDRQNPAGRLNYVDLQSSSLLQSPLEFSLIFNAITG